MPRLKTVSPERLTALRRKAAAAQRDLQRALAVDREQNRRNERRRKIIGGAIAETHALKNPGSEFARVYIRLLKDYVKPQERCALFADTFRALLPAAEAEALLAEVPPFTPEAANEDQPEAAQ